MENEIIENAKADIVVSNLPVLAAELLLWPHTQICVISSDFDDQMVNRNEFEGSFNGFLHEYEEDDVLDALSKCNNEDEQIDLACPLVLSAKILPIEGNGTHLSYVLSMACGATGAWNYEFAAKIEEGKVKSAMIFSRDEKGVPLLKEGREFVNLFNVVEKILRSRAKSRSRVELTIR